MFGIGHAARPRTPGRIAAFALGADDGDLAPAGREALRRSVLDALGCAVGALGSGPVREIRALEEELGGAGQCTLVGGGRAPLDRAALVNGALVRYLDFMDNCAAKGEVCHPSDNLAPLLAAAEHADAGGREFMLALAVAYQVQCRLIASVPTMRAGINYTTPLAFSVAAGASRLLGLDAVQGANALALAGVGAVSLAAIQAEPVSQWKGLASAEAGMRALHNTLLARRGITGPLGVFEGPLGLYALAGGGDEVDWERERLDAVERVSIKRHNAEFQSQSAVDAALILRREYGLRGEDVDAVTVEVAEGAYDVLGGGKYGPKDECHNKEQADHNLQYLVAAALLDGEVWPEQFASERIEHADVQSLLRRVSVKPHAAYTRRVPKEMPARVTIARRHGPDLEVEVADYEGFYARPMSWERVVEKFDRLAAPFADAPLRAEIVAAVAALEDVRVADLTRLLARIRPT